MVIEFIISFSGLHAREMIPVIFLNARYETSGQPLKLKLLNKNSNLIVTTDISCSEVSATSHYFIYRRDQGTSKKEYSEGPLTISYGVRSLVYLTLNFNR